MKKPAKTAEECIEPLRAAIATLASQGADPESIMGALVAVTITTARKTRDAAASLDLAASLFLNAADLVFKQAKKARADRRRKSRITARS